MKIAARQMTDEGKTRWISNALFPLTQALSLRERVNHSAKHKKIEAYWVIEVPCVGITAEDDAPSPKGREWLITLVRIKD